MTGVKASVYGLSTEGYAIASAMAINGVNVSIIDETQRMAISLRPEIARSYPNVNMLVEDEPLLNLEPEEMAIEKSDYLFFAPRIRKVGRDAKNEISTKFKDAIHSAKKGSSIVCNIPLGIGGNNDNIEMIEHVTGMNIGSELNYYYMPLGPTGFEQLIIGSVNAKPDNVMAKVFEKLQGKISFTDLPSAELLHASYIISHYTSLASMFELCRYSGIRTIEEERFREVYFDDISSGLSDLRALAASIEGSGSLLYLVNGSIKSIEGYVRYMIDRVREVLKKRELKSSRIKVSILWNMDINEMRGDKMDLLLTLESKLRDYIADVKSNNEESDLYQSDKVFIAIVCSKRDYERIIKSNKEVILIKANPLCEVIERE